MPNLSKYLRANVRGGDGRLPMKRFTPFFMLLAAALTAAPLAAAPKDSARFNTIVVNRFTNANGMAQSPDFIQYFSDDLSERLENDKIAAHVIEEGTAAPDASTANSVVIEGKFLSHEDATILKPGKLVVEISIYRLSDHALVRTWTPTTHFPFNGDKKERAYAYYTGFAAADQIAEALRTIDIASATPAPPSGTPSPGSAPAPSSSPVPASPPTPAPPPEGVPGTDALASVQLSSDPTGAEITIDGGYVGNTPTLIKLKPGTHTIRMTMSGFAPWERSVETEAGESRNFAATLEKTNP